MHAQARGRVCEGPHIVIWTPAWGRCPTAAFVIGRRATLYLCPLLPLTCMAATNCSRLTVASSLFDASGRASFVAAALPCCSSCQCACVAREEHRVCRGHFNCARYSSPPVSLTVSSDPRVLGSGGACTWLTHVVLPNYLPLLPPNLPPHQRCNWLHSSVQASCKMPCSPWRAWSRTAA